jgi:hypothetical protein
MLHGGSTLNLKIHKPAKIKEEATIEEKASKVEHFNVFRKFMFNIESFHKV